MKKKNTLIWSIKFNRERLHKIIKEAIYDTQDEINQMSNFYQKIEEIKNLALSGNYYEQVEDKIIELLGVENIRFHEIFMYLIDIVFTKHPEIVGQERLECAQRNYNNLIETMYQAYEKRQEYLKNLVRFQWEDSNILFRRN